MSKPTTDPFMKRQGDKIKVSIPSLVVGAALLVLMNCVFGCGTANRQAQTGLQKPTVESSAPGASPAAQQDWAAAQAANTIDTYQQFIERYPTDSHRPQAELSLEQLKASRDWRLAREDNTVRAYDRFLEQHPDSKFAGNAKTLLRDLTAEPDWQTAVAKDNEAGWLNYIVEHWSDARVSAAVTSFARCEAKMQQPLAISSVKPQLVDGLLVVTANINTTSAIPVRYKCLSSTTVYDRQSKSIRQEVSQFEIKSVERGSVEDLKTVSAVNPSEFIASAGAARLWRGSDITHYRGRGIVLMYAGAEIDKRTSFDTRISNLIVIDADFDNNKAVVLLPTATK